MKIRLSYLHILSILIITIINFGLANWLANDVIIMVGRAYPSLLIVSLVASIISYLVTKQKKINATTQVPQLLFKVFEYMLVQSFLILVFWFIVNGVYYNKEHISTFLALNAITLFLTNYLYIRYLRDKNLNVPSVPSIILGQNRFTRQFIRTFKNNPWVGFKYNGNYSPSDFFELNLENYIAEHKIGAVFINWDEFNLSKEREFILRDLIEKNGVKFYTISEIYGKHLLPSSYNLFDNFPYIQLFTFPLDKPINATLKRLFDIFFSLLFFILIASWLFPIIILILIFTQGLPIFFSQKRHGIDHVEFNCYKFRTMVVSNNNQVTVKNDPRVTKIGRILRKTSLDELPQFWNVFIGDMSIVGPRPHMVQQNFYYNELISKYNFRHYVKPGITGLAQVSGFRGEIKENKDMKDRVQADLYYIRNWSFGLDLSIIYRTVANMIKGDKNAI